MSASIDPAGRSARARIVLALWGLVLALGVLAAGGAELGQAELQVAGTRLVLSPAAQTVPFDTPTIVETRLEGYDADLGVLPSSLRVVGDLVGPEIAGVLALETRPGEPFRIPRLRLEGEYRLEDVRLMTGEELLAYAEPREVTVRATQVLLTRISSRPMTLDEIRGHGLTIDDDSYQALQLTFGFGVRPDRVIDFNMPLVYRHYGPEGSWGSSVELVALPQPQLAGGTAPPRFQPPQMVAFELELDRPEAPAIPSGGCDPRQERCRSEHPPGPPLVGVILFPTDVRLLHQFFSVVLMTQNGAPEGDPLVLRDLTARISLPGGLRQAETEPPTPLGVPVPIRAPGADGELGTADDLGFLVAQASGDAQFLLEGLEAGTHVVSFDVEGLLEGLPGGLQRVTGKARGAVVVRDPALSVTISHPGIVRAEEEYPLYLTVSNVGTAPVHLLELELPISRLSGTSVVGPSTQTIEELAAGSSEVVEFRLRSQRTGRVVAATAKSGSSVDPRFELSVGVGNGVPLSPESLVLPQSSAHLPPELLRPALALVGLGHSLAGAPPELGSELPRVGRQVVSERIYRLSQAGRHLDLGEELFEAAALLAAEWAGARDVDWEWDALRRSASHGEEMAAVLGALVEAVEPSPGAAFERFARASGDLDVQLALARGAELEVMSRTSGRRLSSAERDLPFAELLSVGGAELALVAAPEEGGYTVTLDGAGGTGTELRLLVGREGGELHTVRWSGLGLGAEAVARVELAAGASSLLLEVDDDGDGTVDRQLSGTEESLSPRPFEALAAVQNSEVDPSGHVVEVLFSGDVDVASLQPRAPERFELPGKVSNGGLVPIESDVGGGLLGQTVVENPFEGLHDTRVVRVIFDNPVSPLVGHELTVRDVGSTRGEEVSEQQLAVVTTASQPGVQLEGTVIGPDGEPVAFAEVALVESDPVGHGVGVTCSEHRSARTVADAEGRYHFDYVRQTACGDLFRVEAREAGSPRWGSAQGRVRSPETTQRLDVVMVGRGKVHGRVLYEDGSVPVGLGVIAHNAVFQAGRLAHVDAEGFYDAEGVMVGTVSLAATDAEGRIAYATIEVPVAGSVVEKDLTIVRAAAAETAELRGRVLELDATTPVAGAYVALYVDGRLVSTARSGVDGGFDFGSVPAGVAELEAFDGETGRSGARHFLELVADRVHEATLLVRDDRGTVEGHVYRQAVDGSLTPVAGAVVWVDTLSHHTLTDAQGHYRLEDVFAGEWRVYAADLGRAESTSAAVTVGSAGAVVSRDLYFVEALPNGGLTGQVLGYAGEPVAGATVHLGGGYWSTRWHREATTDAEGRFVIPELGPGLYGVHALRGEDGAIAFVEVRFPGDSPSVTVRFRKGTIRGRTLAKNADGELVGVPSQVVYRHVEVIPEWGLVGVARNFTTIVSGQDGSFELGDVLVGPYQLQVYNAFHGQRSASGTLEVHGEVDEHDFVFETTGAIGGVVYERDGETPAVGATVSLRGGTFQDYELTTDAEGRFRFELLPPARYVIEAQHDTGLVFRRQQVTARLREAGEELEVELVLLEQGSVVGWVETAAGEAVPGAVVTLRERGYPWRTIIHNADAVGSFAFDNVFVGEVALSAQAPALGGLGGKASAILSGEAEEVLAPVALEPTGEMVGRVIHPETGDVVTGAQVILYRGTRFFDTTTSDDAGETRFRLLPLGTYQLRAFDPSTGRRGRSAWMEVTASGQVLAAEVVLEVRGEVVGHLYDAPLDTPIPGQVVKLRSYGEHRLTTYASTGVEGGFEFGGIPEGELLLTALGPEGRRRARAEGEILEEDQRLELDLYLEATGRVRGRVLPPAGVGGELFEGANVRVEQGRYVVDASSENPFVLEGLLARHGFTLWAEEPAGRHRGKVRGQIAEEGGEVMVDVPMQAIGSVTVSVVGSDGSPVPAADVAVKSHHLFGHSSFDGSTGADHQVSFEDVVEGDLEVRAADPITGLQGSTTAELRLEGETVAVEVRLQASGTVRGRVLSADGLTPAAGAVVALERGRFYVTEADADGLFAFEAIPMGGYTLTVQEALGAGSLERFGSLSQNAEVDDWGDLVLDESDPEVLSITPVSGERDLPVGTVAVVDFSEAIDVSRLPASAILIRRQSNGGWVPSSLAWSADRARVTITPNAGLASATGYEVFVSTEVVDLAGRHLDWQARSAFYTADVIPPAVIDVLPRDGESQVPVTSEILITFSEPVELASLSGGGLELRDLTAGVVHTTTFQLLPGERVARLTSVSGLVADRQMQVTVQGVRDHAGNTMSAPVVTSFWTPDETPPQLSWLSPAEGASFTSGESVPASVDASDDRGLERVVFEVGEWSFTLTEPPWDRPFPAPYVASATEVVITATAHDLFGNQTSAQRRIDVEPRENALAPELVPLCDRAGDFVVPGEALEIAFTVSDDEAVESYRLSVDGVEVAVVTPVDLASATGSFTWTPPAEALPGEVFLARLEARDFAGNTASHEMALTVPPSLLTGDQALATSLGAELYLSNGVFTAPATLAAERLVLLQGATLTAAPRELTLSLAETLRVQCGSAIELSGQGWSGGELGHARGYAPPGIAEAPLDSGGSHGGWGLAGSGSRSSAEVYGSVYAPLEAGAGGALRWEHDAEAGAGGGALVIEAAEIVLHGDLRVRGSEGEVAWAAGAGGSILLRSQVLGGGGTLDARGGDASSTDCGAASQADHGPGGGGRIAIDVDLLDGFEAAGQALAHGGRQLRCFGAQGSAGPGTVVVRTPSEAAGRLIVDGGVEGSGLELPVTDLPELGSGALMALEAAGADAWVRAAEEFRGRWLGSWMELRDAAGALLGSYRVLEVDAAGRALLEGGGGAAGAAGYRGLYRFDAVEVLGGARLAASDPLDAGALEISGDTRLAAEVVASEVTLRAGATVRPVAGGSLSFEVGGAMVLEAGAVIDVTGLGYAGGGPGHPEGRAPSWVSGAPLDTGGSHGGAGIVPEGDASPAGSYGSVYAPSLGGGGGGLRAPELGEGSAGGGSVAIRAGSLVLDGEIRARGAGGEGDHHAAGAGGSVWLEAASLGGAGVIDVRGGDSVSSLCGGSVAQAHQGSGGGGRVAIDVGGLDGFEPAEQVLAWGGVQVKCFGQEDHAGPGTLWVRAGAAPFGTLVVDGGLGGSPGSGGEVPATVLPSLGSGGVTAFETVGADAWVTAGTPFLPRWLGAWAELLDAGGASLGSFRVLALDAAGRLLLEGAGGVAGVGGYAGRYRFDATEVRGGASLTATDPIEGGALRIDADAQLAGEVVATEVRIESGATVTPAAGGSLRFVVSGAMTVEAGAVIDVSGLGFAGGELGHPQGYAPESVAEAPLGTGGSHGGPGVGGGGDAGAAEVYDSVYHPGRAGAGGGLRWDHDERAGAGGGVLVIEAAELVVDGELRARGGGGKSGLYASGAGGTVSIDADILRGTGLIDASGGDTTITTCAGGPGPIDGAGGGGRVAIRSGLLEGFDPAAQVRARGGFRDDCAAGIRGYAGAGTVYVFGAGSTYGSLIVDQGVGGSYEVPPTLLPSIGPGTVGAVEVDAENPSDLWIESDDLASRFGLGVTGTWLRVGAVGSEVTYPVIGESADRRRLLLEGASGQVGVGEVYVGLYRFDEVTVAGRAHLELGDLSEVAAWSVAAGSTAVHRDVERPVIVAVEPAEGAVFTSGETIPVSAEVSDDGTVAEVRFELGGESFTDTGAPWEWAPLAPSVEVAESRELRVTAVDAAGNSASVVRGLEIEALAVSDPNAPVVVLGECPTPGDGDAVLPGQALRWSFTASDDEAVESYRLTVDGVEQQSGIAHAASYSGSLSWTVPAGAAAGTVYDVRVEARDFGGGVGFAQTLLRVVPGLYLSGSQTLTAALVDGRDVTLGGGSFPVAEPLEPASLRVLGGASVSGTQGQPLRVTASGALHVQCGAVVDTYVQGYAGGTPGSPSGGAPAWVGSSSADAGGSHGGVGSAWTTSGPPGEVYGSVYAPRLAGGGGAMDEDGSGTGGAGGGAVELRAASVRIDGEVRVRGHLNADGSRPAGAAGSILIAAEAFDGRGDLVAVGGWSRSCHGSRNAGSGGGGRIAIHAATIGGFDPPTQMNAAGGSRVNCGWSPLGYAAPGTAYVATDDEPLGWLMVRNGRESNGALRLGPATDLPSLGSGSVSAVEAAGADLWVSAVGGFLPRWELAWMALEDSAGGELGLFRVLELDGAGRARLEGAAAVAGSAAGYAGRYRFDRIDLFDGGGLAATDVVEAGTMSVRDVALLYGEYRASGDVEVAPDTDVYPPPAFEPGIVRLIAEGRLTLGAGALIHTYGRGYSGGTASHPEGHAPAGLLGSQGDTGGSHGGFGTGWSIAGAPGEVYDSVYAPQLAGGGGSYDDDGNGDGGRGGGVIYLEGAEVVLEGELNARGSHSNATGHPTGAGGSVWVRAGELSGAGRIDAGGGWVRSCGSSQDVGAGGGGRVAIHAEELVGFDPATQIEAWGGSQANCGWSKVGWGGVGTVYVETSAWPQGWLLIDPGEEPNGKDHATVPTELPPLGAGDLSGVEIEGADAWVSAAAPFEVRWWGAWMVLVDAQGTELGSFRVVTLDDAGRALLRGAASASASAVSYRGEYRFSRVDLLNGGGLVATDPVIVSGEPLTQGAPVSPHDGSQP